MATVSGLGLDQSQIADTINRQYVGLSQKKKNEMMRVGAQSPDSFALQNQSTLQQAQQPSEFWGAGRQVVNPDTDLSLVKAVGGTTSTLDGQDYYYSPYDMSKTSWGTYDPTQDTDLGKGQYSIMRNGQNLGTGYKSLADTLKDYGLSDKVTNNNLKDWETLGQILNYGKLTGDYSTPHAVGGNNVADPIIGLNTLYGSKPIISDGKIVGYSQANHSTPETDTWRDIRQWSSGGGWFSKPKQHTAWDVGGSALAHNFNDSNWWLQNSQPTSDNNIFIKANDVANSTGWNNNDFFQRDAGQTSSGGGFGLGALTNFLTQIADPLSWELWGKQGPGEFNQDVDTQGAYGAIFDRLDPWLDDLMPDHDYLQNSIKDNLGFDSQKEAFENIAPIFVSAFAPYGGYANAANSANQGNYSGALASLVGQAIGDYAPTATTTGTDAATGAATGSTGVFGSGSSLGSVALDRAAQNLAANTLTGTIANGGNIGQALQSAAFSTASGAAGDWLSKALTPELGDIAGKALGGAASGGLNSLFSGNNAVNGSLYGAMSGGLHGFLNSTAKNNDSFNREVDKKNYQTSMAASKLAKQLFNKAK